MNALTNNIWCRCLNNQILKLTPNNDSNNTFIGECVSNVPSFQFYCYGSSIDLYFTSNDDLSIN